MPLAKGPTTRAMTRRIQEEWASNEHARPKSRKMWRPSLWLFACKY